MRPHRIQVPVDPETLAALKAYAAATGGSLSGSAGKLLATIAPTMDKLAEVHRIAQEAPARATRVLIENAAEHVEDIDQIVMELSPKATGEKTG